jgi:rfaE bifunctional protein nucleotidyltransferase chain/domain
MKKVFVNGTFDLIHPGHIELFNFAKSRGDYLLVALDTDDRIKMLKGSDRPIHKLKDRLLLVENIKSVDRVTFFDTERDLINIIKSYKPQIMIVGSDYRHKKVIGSEYAETLIFFERIPEYSSSKIIETVIGRG